MSGAKSSKSVFSVLSILSIFLWLLWVLAFSSKLNKLFWQWQIVYYPDYLPFKVLHQTQQLNTLQRHGKQMSLPHISQFTMEVLKVNPLSKSVEAVTFCALLSCCVTVAMQKLDTQTGFCDITAFPLALRNAYLMKDRWRIGAHTQDWLSEELGWEMRHCLKHTVDGICLMGQQTVNPSNLSLHCCFI